MSSVSENLCRIQQDIDTSKVKIIAVTKYVDENKIIEAYNAGLRDFAESKVQDAEVKRQKLPEEINKNSTWHFIGHLQTNKAKKVVGNYDYIHSVDSLKLAKYLDATAKEKKMVQKILLQVNIASEETKSGFEINELKEVFKEVISLNSLEICGLMSMAPFSDNEQLLRSVFRKVKELRDYLQVQYNYNLPELSMGMSNDYKIASQEGATMIRLGQVLIK